MHTGEHLYICDMCGKGYSTSTGLKRHEMAHTGKFCPTFLFKSKLWIWLVFYLQVYVHLNVTNVIIHLYHPVIWRYTDVSIPVKSRICVKPVENRFQGFPIFIHTVAYIPVSRYTCKITSFKQFYKYLMYPQELLG